MNDMLAKVVEEHSPKFNKNVTYGSAKDILRIAPSYLDSIFRSSIRSLSPNVPLKYVGYRRMLPEEEFERIITNESNKTNYDLAISDLYVIEYIFEYDGHKIERPIYLPYVDRGNFLRISETYYNIIPILSDTVITPTGSHVFVRLLKDKITFNYKDYNIVYNGQKQKAGVIYATIVKTKNIKVSENSELSRSLTSTSLYLLGRYGLKGVLARYLKDERYIVTIDNVDKYRDSYNVYESTKIKPRPVKLSGYIGHDLKICIHKDIKQPTWLKELINGIIYTFDLLPNQINDFLECYNTNNIKDEMFYWRILLARIAYRNEYSIEKLAQEMKDHFDSLESYLDTLIISKLAEKGIYCDNFYDLLIYIMDNFHTITRGSKEYTSDIKNRYLDILYYILYDIIIGFNKVILGINKRANKKKDEILSLKEVKKIMMNDLKTRAIFNLVKSSAMNIAVHLSDPISDIIYPKVTALLDDQSRGNGVKRGNNNQFPEATKTIKACDLYLGSLLFLNKKAPSPRFRGNLYMNYDIYSGKLLIPNDIQTVLNKLDNLIIGRPNIEEEKISVLYDEEGDSNI